jgi:hypothetical protein
MLDVTLAPPHRRGPLTLFPLIARDAPELPYTLMSDALELGALRITEVGSGTVPELLATNSGDATVLILDGEQLVGARQNRTTNRSLLLPSKSETKIPVSCMEQGRWHFDSDIFTSPKQCSPASVRRRVREVEAARAGVGEPVPADVLAMAQGAVWDTIALNSEALGADSATGALDHLYRERGEDLESWMREFPLQPQQVGLLAFLGARPLGMDLIGCVRLYARLHERLLPGYVLDALGARTRARTPSQADAQRFLDRVAAARRVESPSVGIGRYAVLSGEVIGGELTEEQRAVHLSAFPAAEGPRETRIAPPSRRRR